MKASLTMSHIADETHASTISPLLWRVMLVNFLIVVLGGGILAFFLINGAANPTREHLVLLNQTAQGDVTAPFTLELTNGKAFALTCNIQTLNFRIRDDGYFSVDNGQPDWRQFHHILRGDNALHLHVDESGRFIFRINHEIALHGDIESPSCHYAIIEN